MSQKISNIKPNKYGYLILATCLVLVILLAGCQQQTAPTDSPEAPPPPTEAQPEVPTAEEPAGPQEAPPELLDVEWVLIAYGDAGNPMVVEPGTRPTAVFAADGTISGSGGCNSFTGGFQTDDGTITFSPVATTSMACESGMDQESAYLGAFDSASSYQVEDGKYLRVDYDSGKGYTEQLFFTAETPLVETLWVLASYGDPNDPIPSAQGVVSTAVFGADGALSGSGGCNSYNTTFTAQDNQLTIGLPTSTMMACENGMDQEAAFLAALETAQTYRIGNGFLEISYADGAGVLRFDANHMPLENIRWVLTLIDGQPLPTGLEPHVIFTPGKDGAENQVNGSAGCNSFFGAYSVDADTLSMPGPFGATQMMCEESVMQTEQAFLTGLESAQSYSIVLKGLTINTASGSLTFFADRFPLQGPIWKLVSLGEVDNPRPPIEGTDFTATFQRDLFMPSGNMSGTTGCNDYVSVYYADLKNMLVNLPGLLANTCSDAISEEQQAYFLGLNSAREYRILGNELEIVYDGMMLKFTGSFPSVEAAPGPLAPLDGTKWWLYSIGASLAIPGSETTAEFAINPDGMTGQVGGSTGCNSYNAEITGVFTVGPANATQALCDTPAGIMEQESAYLAALSAAQGFSLEGDRLLINTGLGELVFTNQGPAPVQPLPPTETPEAVQPLPPPTAVISAPNTGQVGETITFDGSGSTASSEITAYQWDFGDGATAEGPSIDHVFEQPGVYVVTLTITDVDDQTGSATLEVTIN